MRSSRSLPPSATGCSFVQRTPSGEDGVRARGVCRPGRPGLALAGRRRPCDQRRGELRGLIGRKVRVRLLERARDRLDQVVLADALRRRDLGEGLAALQEVARAVVVVPSSLAVASIAVLMA